MFSRVLKDNRRCHISLIGAGCGAYQDFLDVSPGRCGAGERHSEGTEDEG